MEHEFDYVSYRPGYNPAFIERARRNAKKRERQSRTIELKRTSELARLEASISQRMQELRVMESRNREALSKIEDANARLCAMYGNFTPFSRIVRRISTVMKVTPEELMSDRRHKDIVLARQAIFYWARRRTRLSLPEIGRRMGGRDHTTVLHGADAYPKKRAKAGRYLRAVR